ncbi:MAG TPA: septal ring lytic transglycosylase RlpA family protein [Pseudolabrys sp.]
MARTLWISAGFALACGMANGGACAQGPKQIAGVASYYDKNYSGRTASGAHYDGNKLTAAHRTLPFGTRLNVTDPRTHRAVTVVVNDRGPFVKGRVLDLSYAAAQVLHMTDRGLINVTAAIE